MRIETSVSTILELIDRPAFCVSDGVIQAVNQSAADRMIQPGSPICPMIAAGAPEYQQFTSGQLFLTLSLNGIPCNATVHLLGIAHLFILDSENESQSLQAFALAAQELRQPLSQIMALSDTLFPTLDLGDEKADQISRINRGLYQLIRMVGNMSDAGTAGITRMEIRDLTAVLQEFFEHACALCEHTGIRLSFHNHPVSVYTLIDAEKLERGIYHLLSNAIKNTAPGGEIHVEFRRKGNSVVLTIRDTGGLCEQPLPADVYRRYLREPGLSRHGLGLGLTLVRAVAAAHQGVLLLDQADGGTRATLSFPIRQTHFGLSSPTMRLDYAGERDCGLIELSESLPPELFSPRKS